MRVHILQHVSFEGLGSIEPWLLARKARVTWTRFHESAELPSVTAVDFLIILGGPMSVNDEAGLPWLIAEKEFIREAIVRNIPVLGICLGAQLIASALGARIYPGKEKEIGWHPISPVAIPAGADACPLPAGLVFHWHGETFDLPAGATHLARSEGCEHQAFQIGRRVLALQFHLETTPTSVDSMIQHCGAELLPGPYIQTAEQLRNPPIGTYAAINGLMARVLDYLIEGRN